MSDQPSIHGMHTNISIQTRYYCKMKVSSLVFLSVRTDTNHQWGSKPNQFIFFINTVLYLSIFHYFPSLPFSQFLPVIIFNQFLPLFSPSFNYFPHSSPVMILSKRKLNQMQLKQLYPPSANGCRTRQNVFTHSYRLARFHVHSSKNIKCVKDMTNCLKI